MLFLVGSFKLSVGDQGQNSVPVAITEHRKLNIPLYYLAANKLSRLLVHIKGGQVIGILINNKKKCVNPFSRTGCRFQAWKNALTGKSLDRICTRARSRTCSCCRISKAFVPLDYSAAGKRDRSLVNMKGGQGRGTPSQIFQVMGHREKPTANIHPIFTV